MKNKIVLSVFMIGFLSLIYWSMISNSKLPLIGKCLLSLVLGIISALTLNKIFTKFVRYIRKVNFAQLILGVCCINLSCVCGSLFSIPISALPGYAGKFGPIITVFLITIFNALLFSYRKEALCDLANRITNGKIQLSEVAAQHEAKVLLDTSVIIDGRIADIAHCGFIPRTLIIPNFILQELQFIADSEDSQRRQRGRRGLETLSNMQKDREISIQISDFDVPNVRDVDAKLMHVALELGCPILTNDYNLNKVAELQGIRILNVNDLANAVKSILLPGEKLIVTVIQEGKETNQGVGYMEDGTMVVVENGRAFLNQQIDVIVTKILQTAAGRMIFARHEKELGVKR